MDEVPTDEPSGLVVVGVAASPETHYVLDAARTFSKRLGAKLCLVHAIGLPTGVPFDALAYPSVAYADALRADGEAYMKRVRGDLDPGELGSARVVSDAPWRAICDAAEGVHASMIIVGSHDPRMSDALLGTTAAKVASRAKTQVLVVRRHTQALMHALAFHQMLVALDGSERAPLVLDTAMRIAKDEHARLTLLRVVPPPPSLLGRFLGVTPARLEGELRAKALTELEHLRAALPPDMPAKLEVRVGSPWQHITELARHINADLIVVGSHGYEMIDAMLGTTAAKVVNHTDRSVLIAR
jgi:nucleotide-binding universal stress UspA family protein